MESDRVKWLVGRLAMVALLVLVISPSLRMWNSIPGADYTIAEAERGQGLYDQAIERFNALIKSDPKDARYYAGRGETYRLKGDRARAFADFDAALQRNPHSFETYMFRCDAYRAGGEIDAAIKDCEEAAIIRITNPEPLIRLGLMLFARGDLTAARTKFERAAQLQGELFAGVDSRLYLGEIALFYDNRPVEAAASFAPAIKHLFDARGGAGLMTGNENAHFDELVRLILWQHVARLRASEDDTQEFAANLKRLGEPVARRWVIDHMLESATDENVLAATLRPWPGPLVSLYLGQLAPGDLHAAAQGAGNPDAQRRRDCEADFYAGLYHLTKGARDLARKHLQTAADGCPASASEAGFAKAEIARIGT